jgi:1-acyl-sn-glycerol-3-phosphate acyltransferase
MVLRAVLSSTLIVLFTVVGAALALGARLFDRTGDRVIDLARLWSRLVLACAGVKVEVEWRGQLEPGRPYVFMANHASSVDIWTLFVALPLRVRMIAKKQLRAIPILGWAMWAGRFIFVDRENAAAARRSIEEAERRIRNGDNVLLFPEGTRTRDGTLGPFKKGGFHLAINAGVPVVPVALMGAREVMPRGSLLLRSGRVRVIVDAPIPTEGMTEGDRNRLLEDVRGKVAAMLAPPGEPGPVSKSLGQA